MKALSASALALVLAAIPILTMSDDVKLLTNQSGQVTYGTTNPATRHLAPHANTTLADSDWAQTGGGKSMATIRLPDSSVLTMGANSDVQMQSFNQTDIAHAKFVVVGKVRFKVEHPAGAKADYTFQTATGQIAVRGTEGDILALQDASGAPAGLQVNVYELSSPKLPVQVTLKNGQVFTLSAGQSLVVTAAAGALVGAVGAVTNSTFAPFAQLGAPANASSLGITTATSATSATAAAATASTAATTTAAAVAAGTAAATTVISNSNPPATAAPTPTPTPMPTPTTTPTMMPTMTPTPTSTTLPVIITVRPHPIPIGPHPVRTPRP